MLLQSAEKATQAGGGVTIKSAYKIMSQHNAIKSTTVVLLPALLFVFNRFFQKRFFAGILLVLPIKGSIVIV